MTSNPYNLVLRLLIEVYGYIAFGFAGFFITETMLRWPLAIIFPVAAGIFWGTFYAEKDPAGVGKEIIRITGVQRIVLEFMYYAVALTLSFIFVNTLVSFIYLYLIIIHNIFSFDRLRWLVKNTRENKMNNQSAS